MEHLGITTVRIDLPFRLNHVNCFIAEGEKGWIIIDAGLHNETTRKTWEPYLQDKEITDIYITHYHPDHYGYAGQLQQLTGASLSMSETDAVHGRIAWTETFFKKLPEHYEKVGLSQELGEQLLNNTKSFVPKVTPYPTVNHFLQEGQLIKIGNRTYEIIFTPGHSDGLICFYNKDDHVLLSMDHVLPKITPNISYWFHGNENPLESYFCSLEKVKQLDAQYVIPSHGKPFYDGNKRINEIMAHHDDRLNQLLDCLNVPKTVYEASKYLFKDLTIHETRFAVGETLAHLDYLYYKKECLREKDDKNRFIYYR